MRLLKPSALVVAIALAAAGCGSTKTTHSTATSTASAPGTPTTAGRSAPACNPLTATVACPIARITLTSISNTSIYGVAEVLQKGTQTAIAIAARGVPANTAKNAYAIWLYNSPSDTVRLGFVNPGVGKNGRLDTAGSLPANAARYRDLVISLETQQNPVAPSSTVLQGRFSER